MDEARSPTSANPLLALLKPKSPSSSRSAPQPPPPYKGPSLSSSVVPGPSLYNDVYSTVKEADESTGVPDYAELKDVPARESVAADAEGVRNGPVSKAKFDLVMDRLRKLQVSVCVCCPLNFVLLISSLITKKGVGNRSIRGGPTSVRQLRHSYHVISIKRVAFNVADSAFYNVHMIGMS